MKFTVTYKINSLNSQKCHSKIKMPRARIKYLRYDLIIIIKHLQTLTNIVHN
jgi:hypothetical protein